MRYFDLDSRASQAAEIHAALRGLGAEIVYGPRTTGARPDRAFVAVRAPRSTPARSIEYALRQGGGRAEPLAALAFEGRTGEDHELVLARITKRDLVLGMSGDVRWYDTSGTWSQLFGRPGKLDPHYFVDRFEKIHRPYGEAKLGTVARETFTWTLASAPDAALRASVSAELRKLRGAESVDIDGANFTMTVVLKDLEVCGDVGAVPEGPAIDYAGREAPRIAFDAGAAYEILRREGLVDAPSAAE